MINSSKTVSLFLQENDHCKRLKDPTDPNRYHLETYVRFSEAAKLDPGNANVRTASEVKKPYKDMLRTVEVGPQGFHVKNRGITFICQKFEFDNASKKLTITVPDSSKFGEDDDDAIKYGIADGGHTFEVIKHTVQNAESHKSHDEEWTEPFVRIHFIAGEGTTLAIDEIVEALNTSSQVQQFTIDEYQSKFDPLKAALKANGFPIEQIAFRENDEREWDVREIVQRLACFLKDRWKNTPPANMYKSKKKALDLFTTESTMPEFLRLSDVMAELVTFPEFIESGFSVGGALKSRNRFGGLRAVKKLSKPTARPGTNYPREYQMDLAASLPLAAAFREILELRGERYYWAVDPKLVFERCAEDLYKLLVNKSKTIKAVSNLGSDTEYWTQASLIVMRAKMEILQERGEGFSTPRAVPVDDIEDQKHSAVTVEALSADPEFIDAGDPDLTGPSSIQTPSRADAQIVEAKKKHLSADDKKIEKMIQLFMKQGFSREKAEKFIEVSDARKMITEQ